MKRKRRANSKPGGGGGGGCWAEMSRKQPESRAKLQDKIAAGEIEGGIDANQSVTSIFDPVLAELIYRWFCPRSGLVLDPFAGGSVRGIVASRLKRHYLGVDLRPEQIAANEAQAREICGKGDTVPKWVTGDSANIDKIAKGIRADLVFSCPPYADLEVYSDNPRDLSTMEYPAFRAALVDVIAKVCALLKNDRFACFVVGDARDAAGMYYGLPAHTMDAFVRAGLRLYNEAILVTAAGSLPLRTNKQFTASRKLGNTHQNVLIFVKGDPVKATAAIGEVEFGDVTGVDTLAPGMDPALAFGAIL
jgi:hypothetical protein